MANKKILRITESDICNIVKNVLKEYDQHMLDGIDEMDERGFDYVIRELIPQSNRISVNNPYKPIRQLCLFFSENGAMKHGSGTTARIVRMMLDDPKIGPIIGKIQKLDGDIRYLIYKNKMYRGSSLAQMVIYKVDEINSLLFDFNEALSKSNLKGYFSETEAMQGSENGKLVGLAKISIACFKACGTIKKELEKLQKLLDKRGRY